MANCENIRQASIEENSLKDWLLKQPKWLQEAAKHLLRGTTQTDELISEIVSFCKEEALGNFSLPDGKFPLLDSAKMDDVVRLISIGDIGGVNALAPKKTLEFDNKDLVVVYGNNGSGKSGYVRLLRHIIGDRNLDVLHNNIYEPSQDKQKAVIRFKKNGREDTYSWTQEGGCNKEIKIDIFDTSFGKVFMDDESEVNYEPPELSFFSDLIKIADKVSKILDDENNGLVSCKPNVSSVLSSADKTWFESICADTDISTLETFCSFTSENEEEVALLQKRLEEKSPEDKAKQLKASRSVVTKIVEDVKILSEKLSIAVYQNIVEAKNIMQQKKEALETAIPQIFGSSDIEGIGTDTWKALWFAARKFSEEEAYKGTSFPNIESKARCVLCHQVLSEEARVSFVSFENFVKGELQTAYEDALNRYDSVIKPLNDMEMPKAPDLDQLEASIPRENDFIINQIQGFYSTLESKKNLILNETTEYAFPNVVELQWFSEIQKIIIDYEGQIEKYTDDAKNDNRAEVETKLKTLLSKKCLRENQGQIKKEIERLKQKKQIEDAKKLTNTAKLSRKKGELAESLITEKFVNQFNEELKFLTASNIRVELVKTKTDKGHVFHRLQLKNASGKPIREILSEGEMRIVSLSAFLAELCLKPGSVPLVFDDPISSLDQDFEDAVVKRLAALSKNRQVIIFTHRISLVGIIEDCKIDDHGVICVKKEHWGTGEPGEVPIHVKNPITALRTIKCETLPKAKKRFEEEGNDAYEPFAQAICSDFRKILERMIEKYLISGIVERHRRSVQTLNKIQNLAKITKEDCDLFDSLMTKYSRYEHSQPTESPIALPSPEDIEKDCESLLRWETEFTKRQISE